MSKQKLEKTNFCGWEDNDWTNCGNEDASKSFFIIILSFCLFCLLLVIINIIKI